MAGEKTPPQTRFDRIVACDLDEGAEHGETRMRQRIALAARRKQQRGARIDFKIGGVRREPRYQDQRRAVDIGGDIDQRRERMPGIAIDGGQRAGARCAQQVLGDSFGLEARGAGGIFRQAIRHGAGKRR